MRRGLLILALGVCAIGAQGEIYKWVDADGKVQYGDVPPKEIKTKKVSGGVTVVPAAVLTTGGVSAPAKTKASEETGDDEGMRAAIRRKTETAASSSASASRSSSDPVRQRLVEQCERNRGSNCENEADAQLNNQLNARPATVFVPVPGWSQPPIRPRHPPVEQHASSSSERSYRVAPPPSAQSSSRQGPRKPGERDRE